MTIILFEPELFSATTLILLGNLLEKTFSTIFPTSVGYFVSDEVRYGGRQVPQAKKRPRKIHFGIFACSNLIITCKQPSTEPVLWGVFLQPLFAEFEKTTTEI